MSKADKVVKKIETVIKVDRLVTRGDVDVVSYRQYRDALIYAQNLDNAHFSSFFYAFNKKFSHDIQNKKIELIEYFQDASDFVLALDNIQGALGSSSRVISCFGRESENLLNSVAKDIKKAFEPFIKFEKKSGLDLKN